jgi:predicted alpha/beta-fold hydrolase
VPYVTVQAADDPLFASEEALLEHTPWKLFEENPNLMFVLTNCGSHIGHLSGSLKGSRSSTEIYKYPAYIALEHFRMFIATDKRKKHPM